MNAEDVDPIMWLVHWPGQDVVACAKHGAQLKKMGDIIGCSISVTPIPFGVCKNCEREAKDGNRT